MELKEDKRSDGRDLLQMRPPHLDVGSISRTHGSATFSFGLTSVTATVQGPFESNNPRKTLLDSLFISVYFESMEKDTSPSDRAIESVVQAHLLACIDGSSMPMTVINVAIIPRYNDGSLLACSINAAIAACLHAGLPFKRVALGVSVGTVKDSDRILVDLMKNEEASSSDDEIRSSYSTTFCLDLASLECVAVWPEYGMGASEAQVQQMIAVARQGVLVLGVCFRTVFSKVLSTIKQVSELNTAESEPESGEASSDVEEIVDKKNIVIVD